MWTGVLLLAKPKFSLLQRLSLLGVLVVLTILTLLLPPVIPLLAGFIPVLILIRLNSGRIIAYSLVSAITALATLKVGSVWLLYPETRLDFKIIGSINLITLMLITWLSLGLVEKAVSKISQAQKWAWQHQEQLKLSLLDFEEKQVLGQTAGQDVFAITETRQKWGRFLEQMVCFPGNRASYDTPRKTPVLPFGAPALLLFLCSPPVCF